MAADGLGIDREHAILLARSRMYMEEPRPFPAVWLGAPEPWWAWEDVAHARLMLSVARIRSRESSRRNRLRTATVPIFLDSGAFMWLKKHASWATWPADDFAAFVAYAARELGGIDHAGIQDWMCEAAMLARTGLTIEEHQRRTVANYLELRSLAPHIPWVPTLQGHTVAEYLRCAQMYRDAGVDLADAPLVGLGSVCRRDSAAEIDAVISAVRRALGDRVHLHGYGVKSEAAVAACWQLAGFDSMAWSDRARHLEADLRRALGLPVSAPPSQVSEIGEDRLARLDLDLLDFWEWKRDAGVGWAQNSPAWAEHWRARQIEALAVEIIDRMLAGGALREGPGQLELAG